MNITDLSLVNSEKPDAARIIRQRLEIVKTINKYYLGYPENTNVYTDENLQEFFKVFSMNCGDPFSEKRVNVLLNDFEKEVLLYFAKLWNLRDEEPWGYITSSSSEALMYALYNAKMYFNTFPENKGAVVLYSA